MASRCITIGGRERELRYNLRGLKALESRLGMSMKRAMGITINPEETDPEQRLSRFAEWAGSMEGVAALIWAGLRHEQPEVTMDDIDDWVEMPMLPAIQEAINEALRMDTGTAAIPPANGEHPNGASPSPRKAPVMTGSAGMTSGR